MSQWLNIIGVGEKGVGELPAHLRELVTDAFTVIGPFRFLAGIKPIVADVEVHPELVRQRSLEAVARALLYVDDEDVTVVDEEDLSRVLIEWQGGIDEMLGQILPLRGSPTVILATGDPMWFGIGATLAKHLEPDEFVIHTHPGAFQLAAAKMRWPIQHITTISLHGRPIELIAPHILPGNRILALTTDSTTIDRVADILANRGYGQSMLTALENLGGVEEKITSSIAEDFNAKAIGDFYVLAVDCVADKDAALLATVPGLPDEAFVSDGQLTKREVRAATLAKLAPYPGALLWDVGAGCGSIGIEWIRAARDTKAVAFERDEKRIDMIGDNMRALGAPTLEVVSGAAPDSFGKRTAPDAIFIGGGIADDELFDACWEALKPGGRLVANAVTLDGEQSLILRQEQHGGELTRFDVSSLDTIGKHKVMRARLPVTQWSVQKP